MGWGWFGRGSSSIEPWMLQLQGLCGLCQDYLDVIDLADSSQDPDTLHELDKQRHVAHGQLLQALRIDRSHPLDMPSFARQYLRENC